MSVFSGSFAAGCVSGLEDDLDREGVLGGY